MKRFEIVQDNEDAIFDALSDALFLEETTKPELELFVHETGETDVDAMVAGALKRALNISLPDGRGWYNGSKGRK
jgi:hypothetical protein